MRSPYFLVALLLLGACATTPPTSVHQPMSVRPQARAENPAGNGSIFQSAGASRSLFEDRRARYVGDTLTINISERNTGSTKSNTKNERDTDLTAAVNGLQRVPGKSFQGLDVRAATTNNLDAKGESAVNNVFTGTITVTVIETLANGNLLVSGEKQVAINQGHEFIRFSGVVNPNNITAANAVSSAQVADARIEFKGSGQIDEAQVMGWLARFFLTFLPF